jgi:hypothetical protein
MHMKGIVTLKPRGKPFTCIDPRDCMHHGGLIQAKTGHEKAAQTAKSHIVYKSY